MEERIAVAGFGGQGVMAIGQLLTFAGMKNGYNVSWFPSYGPEMRGGTANCSVVITDGEVYSPVVDKADVAIVMNLPSLDKFEPLVNKGGKIFINSSIVDRKSNRDDVEVHYVPANDIALELGNIKVANMVILGAYLATIDNITEEDILEVFTSVFGENKAKFKDINKEALERGMATVKENK